MSQFTGLVTGRQQIEGDSSETNSVNCDDFIGLFTIPILISWRIEEIPNRELL